MAQDEIGAFQIVDFQKEVLAETGTEISEELKREAWKWVAENDVNPRHLENSLVRYSSNFSPANGSQPLLLGEEPPEDLDLDWDPEEYDLER